MDSPNVQDPRQSRLHLGAPPSVACGPALGGGSGSPPPVVQNVTRTIVENYCGVCWTFCGTDDYCAIHADFGRELTE